MSHAQIKQVDERTAAVTGVIEVDNAMSLKAQGEALIKTLGSAIQIDLEGVEHSGSVGVSILLAWMREAKAQGKDIVFKNMPAKMFDIARVSGLDEVFPLSNEG